MSKCFQTIPIIELRKHSFTCSAIEVSDSSGDEELQSSPFDDKVLNESASCAASSAKQGCSSGASFIDEGIASLPSLFPDVPIENVRDTLVKYENVNLVACALMTSGTDVNKKIKEIKENKDVHDILRNLRSTMKSFALAERLKVDEDDIALDFLRYYKSKDFDARCQST